MSGDWLGSAQDRLFDDEVADVTHACAEAGTVPMGATGNDYESDAETGDVQF